MENMCVYRSFILPIIGIVCGLIFSIIIISAIVIPSYAVNSGRTLSAKFYANDGSVKDQFTIKK
jgi:hypothetical protein